MTAPRDDPPRPPMPEPPVPPPPEPVEFPARFGPAFRAWLGAALAVWFVRLCVLPGAFAMSLLYVAVAVALVVDIASGVRRFGYDSPGSILGTVIALASYAAVLGAYSSWAPVGVGPGERAVARGATVALGMSGGAVLAIQTEVLLCA